MTGLYETWGPATVALGGALVAAAIYLRRSRSPDAPASVDPESAQRRVELKMEQLRELDADRHLMTDDAFAAQREKLEAEAADALRARDAQTAAPPSPPTPPAVAATGLLARSPQLKGALWGGGVVLFFVALGLFLGQDNRPREDGEATGQSPGMRGGQGAGPTAEDPELEALRARLERSPDDVEAATRAAHLLLKRQDLDNAEALTFRALVVDPFHTEARIHRALLRAARGNGTAAEQELTHLADRYPNAHEALLYLGMLRLERGDKRAALEAFEHFIREAPAQEQPPMIGQTLTALRAELKDALK